MRILTILLVASLSFGFLPEQKLADPQKEALAQTIIAELRCFVCQGQPLAQSDVSLAQDLRKLVRQKIAEGQSKDDILSFIAKRYGSEVLLRPPLTANTLLLWCAPFIVLLGGALFLWRRFFNSRRPA